MAALRTSTRRAAIVLALLSLAAPSACSDRQDLDGARRPPAGLEVREQVHRVALGEARVVHDLLANRASAVVFADGALIVEAGTAEMAKYIGGGARSPWHVGIAEGGRRVALTDGLGASLEVPLDFDEGGVARAADGSVQVTLRARAARAEQLASVFLNEQRLGDIGMPEARWARYQIRAADGHAVAGENALRFYFRHAEEEGGVRTAAAVERLAIGSGDVDLSGRVLTAGAVSRGDAQMPALRVARAARLSYYLMIPRHSPALAFAAGGPAAMAVRVALDGNVEEVWSAPPAGDRWRDVRIDLGRYAGEVVRIDLASTGPADWGRPQLVTGAPEPGLRRVAAADHVIVWTVAALRADRLGGEMPTPGLSRLASRAVRFSETMASSPVPGPAHVAMLTGRYPQADGVPADAKTLGERFSEAGFATAMYSGNGFVNDEAGFARGFDVYDNPMRRRHPFSATILWQKARRRLQKLADGQTFTYLATVEPHLPYTPSPERLAARWSGGEVGISPASTAQLAARVAAGTRRLTASERAYLEALYDAEVADVDAALGQMLTDLEELGIAERTAIIVVGDHGEELLERGQLGHGQSLHQESVAVPLLVVWVGDDQGRGTISRVAAATMDVHATALALAGITPGVGNQGVDLLAVSAPDPAVARPVFSTIPGRGRALRMGDHKLIVPAHGPQQLYDLGDDPAERIDLAAREPVVLRALRNVFGLLVAYEDAWSRDRWGSPAAVREAFASDHGL